MGLNLISDMRRDLRALKTLADAQELTPLKFQQLMRSLSAHVDTVEAYLDAADVSEALAETPSFALTESGRAALLGLQRCEVRFHGHLASIDGGRS